MANTPAAAVKANENGIIVTAEAGFYEVWNGEDCLGYVKGPGEKTFALKRGKHEIVIYCAGRLVLRKTVTVGARTEPHEQEVPEQEQPEEQPDPQASVLSLDRLVALKALLVPLVAEIEQAIGELKGAEK